MHLNGRQQLDDKNNLQMLGSYYFLFKAFTKLWRDLFHFASGLVLLGFQADGCILQLDLLGPGYSGRFLHCVRPLLWSPAAGTDLQTWGVIIVVLITMKGCLKLVWCPSLSGLCDVTQLTMLHIKSLACLNSFFPLLPVVLQTVTVSFLTEENPHWGCDSMMTCHWATWWTSNCFFIQVWAIVGGNFDH